jgi:hypothetical protein
MVWIAIRVFALVGDQAVAEAGLPAGGPIRHGLRVGGWRVET